MITEHDLREAIAECQGERNPNSNTCIKLAAFYTILEHMGYEKPDNGSSFDTGPKQEYVPVVVPNDEIRWEGDSEFARKVRGLPVSHIMPIIDELMTVIQAINPRLYAGVMRKIT